MNKFIFLILLISNTLLSVGQTFEDKQDIIQKCIDFKELQKYFTHENKQLIILDNGVVSSDLTLIKFDKPVKFMTKEALFFYDEKSYLDFAKFDLKASSSYVEFEYVAEKIIVKLTFDKIDGNWVIKSQSLTVKYSLK